MGERLEPSQHHQRARQQVAAAILLVADGRYPEVTVANIDDAAVLAAELAEEADRRGVTLTLTPGATDRTRRIIIQCR